MQCPSCDHEAPQAAFGDPLRCPECGAFYEKALALKLKRDLAAEPTPAPVAPIAPTAPVKKRKAWPFFVVPLLILGFIGAFSEKPETPAAEVAPANTDAPPVAQAGPKIEVTSEDSALSMTRLEYKWGKKHSSLMVADFTVINNSRWDIKDIEIECVHSGASGTRIDSNTRTIYEIVPVGSRKSFKGFDMGFIHSQAVKSSCSIVSLKL